MTANRPTRIKRDSILRGSNAMFQLLLSFCKEKYPETVKYFYPEDGYENWFVRPIASFPPEVDRTLFKECPLDYIVDYIKYQHYFRTCRPLERNYV